MGRMHDRKNIGKVVLSFEKEPEPRGDAASAAKKGGKEEKPAATEEKKEEEPSAK